MKRFAVFMVIVLAAFSGRLYCEQDEVSEFRKLSAKLNLTEEQKKDADKIRYDMEKQIIAQKAKLATAQLELRQLFKADNPDKTAIEKKINEMSDLNVQMRMIRINSWFSVNKLLTPEQQKIWKKALEFGPDMRQHMGMRNKGRHPLPPDPEAPMPK